MAPSGINGFCANVPQQSPAPLLFHRWAERKKPLNECIHACFASTNPRVLNEAGRLAARARRLSALQAPSPPAPAPVDYDHEAPPPRNLRRGTTVTAITVTCITITVTPAASTAAAASAAAGNNDHGDARHEQ